MAAVVSTSSISGGNASKTRDLVSVRSGTFVKTPLVTIQTKTNRSGMRRNLSVSASNRGGDFLAGFIVGGAICGALAYVFAPQVRKAILNENEHGFVRARRPPYAHYYDEEDALERTRNTLSEKISQLNSAIDSVYWRLKGGNNASAKPINQEPDFSPDVAP